MTAGTELIEHYWQEWFRWTVQHSLCYIRLTKWLASWSKFHLDKLIFLQSARKFSSFYGNGSFITSFTIARHLSLYGASSIHSMPPPSTSWISTLILSSHLHPVLPTVLFPSYYPTVHLCTSPLPIRATCTTHPIIFDLLTWIMFGEEWRSLSSRYVFFFTPLLSRPNILLSTLFWNTLSPHSLIWATKFRTHKE